MKKNLLIYILLVIAVYPTYGQVFDDDYLTSPDTNFVTQNSSISSIDTDKDGVPDDIDLDDDNDGILDADECIVAINLSGNNVVLTAADEEDIQIGEKVLYTDAVMKDNKYYDIVFTLLEKSNPDIQVEVTVGISARYLNPFKDDYIRYKLDLVERGSATPANPDGKPVTMTDIILILADVDSLAGTDFTEVTGIEMGLPTSPEKHYLPAGSFLENKGFLKGGPALVGTNALYRLKPKDAAKPNWRSSWPSSAGDIENKVFFKYLEFNTLNATFGVTGGYNSKLSGVRKNYFDIDSPCDEDRDDYVNRIDIDSDNDGIPDNVEAQPTLTYKAPSTTVDANGIPINYGGKGLSPLEDTDGDGIKDFKDLDTDGDNIPDIQENGMANAVVPLDTDGDGLDNSFEGANINDPSDVNDEIDDPTDLSVLPDDDGDLFSGGDLDYRDAITHPANAIIDFDGVDDYVDSNVRMSGYKESTLMAWIKLDENFNTQGHIAGEDLFRLVVAKNGRAKLELIVAKGPNKTAYKYALLSNTLLRKNCWYHISATFNSNTGKAKIYINGEYERQLFVGNKYVLKTNASTKNNFTIGKLAHTNTDLYKGCIDEVRLFDKTLTDSQIQGMVYQEIEKNGQYIYGSVVPKKIIDMDTGNPIKWNSLQVYYRFDDINDSKTSDHSRFNKTAYLHNIATTQEQTAPMPYTTTNNGEWTAKNTWLNGDVLDIYDIKKNKPWSIVNIKHDVSTKYSHTNLGLFINDNVTLQVEDDNAIINSYYVQLNGSIDLLKDSQLIQGIRSDLVTSSNGAILRRQEGTSNKYWYNYWSSPVGKPQFTSLMDDNTNFNNTNNTGYSLDMLKFGDGKDALFTQAYDEKGKVSTKWLHKYENGVVYADWKKIAITSMLKPGQGYSQKGTGIDSDNQQYIFEGRPNNGTIKIDVVDTGGPGSVNDVSLTSYLLGNPYPSALDIREFIKDNRDVIYGTIYIWEQWAGKSHITEKYQGGYGTINLTATVRAYQHPGVPIADQEQTKGVKLPTFNLAVSQGFFTEIVNNGQVVFKNSQRKFVKEADADGTNPNNGSIFTRNTQGNSEMGIVRLEFGSPDGSTRHLVLGFSNETTDAFDYGYDGRTISPQENDLNSSLNGEKMTIQAYSPITKNKVIDLIFNSKTENELYSIKGIQFSNINEDYPIYLKDNYTGVYYDLKANKDKAYEFVSHEKGEDKNRFDIVFTKETLSVANTIDASSVTLYLKNNTLYAKGLSKAPKQVQVTDILGKVIKTVKNPSVKTLESGITLSNLSTGTYVVSIINENSKNVITKKVISK